MRRKRFVLLHLYGAACVCCYFRELLSGSMSRHCCKKKRSIGVNGVVATLSLYGSGIPKTCHSYNFDWMGKNSTLNMATLSNNAPPSERKRPGWGLRTGWSNLRNTRFLMLFEQNKQNWFQKCYLIVSFVNHFGEFDDSPFKEIGAALGCPRGVSKMVAEWHDLS